MTARYYRKFDELTNFSLSDVEEQSGKIVKAVLNIDSRGLEYKLTLENPKVPSAASTTVRDLFSDLTLESVDFFEIVEEHVQWHIRTWKDGGPPIDTIHCSNIQGLPPE